MNTSDVIFYASTAHPRDELRVHLKQINSLIDHGFKVVFLVCDGHGFEERENLKIIDFGIPSSRWIRFFVKPLKMFRYAKLNEARSFHFHDPEFLLPNILMGKKIFTIYDCHEDVLGSILHRRWVPKWGRRPLSKLFKMVEKISIQRLGALITATDSISETHKFQNILVINNYPFLSEFDEPQKDKNNEIKSACYVGSISLERGIENCVKACAELGVELHIAGWFSDQETQIKLEAMQEWSLVKFYGSVPRTVVKKLYSSVDFGLVTFMPLPNHIQSQPNKLFEYLSADLPVICSDFPKWRDLIEKHALGVCCDPTSLKDIKAAIRRLQDNPTEFKGHGRKYIRANASWENEKNKLIKFYRDLNT